MCESCKLAVRFSHVGYSQVQVRTRQDLLSAIPSAGEFAIRSRQVSILAKYQEPPFETYMH